MEKAPIVLIIIGIIALIAVFLNYRYKVRPDKERYIFRGLIGSEEIILSRLTPGNIAHPISFDILLRELVGSKDPKKSAEHALKVLTEKGCIKKEGTRYKATPRGMRIGILIKEKNKKKK